jgi:hypothetical protein
MGNINTTHPLFSITMVRNHLFVDAGKELV